MSLVSKEQLEQYAQTMVYGAKDSFTKIAQKGYQDHGIGLIFVGVHLDENNCIDIDISELAYVPRSDLPKFANNDREIIRLVQAKMDEITDPSEQILVAFSGCGQSVLVTANLKISSTDSKDYFNRASLDFQRGDLRAAIKNLSAAIQLDPNYAEAYYSRGYMKNELGEHNSALEDYTRAIQLKADYADAYMNRATTFYQLGDIQKAVQDGKITQNLFLNQNNRQSALRANAFLNLLGCRDYDLVEQPRLESVYDSFKNQEDLTEALKKGGKRISKASCITQIFPEDGALLQCMPVGNNLSIGAQLEKDLDTPSKNIWCLLPMLNSTDKSLSPKPASYELVKEHLEEFIVCTKACLAAYKKLNGTYPNVRSASSDPWLASNYMAVFYSIENQWDVECKGVEVDPNKCWLELEKKIIVVVEREQEKTLESNPSSSSSLTNFENPSDYSSENKVKKLIALGVGSLGAVLLLSGIWFIALICLGLACFLWQSV